MQEEAEKDITEKVTSETETSEETTSEETERTREKEYDGERFFTTHFYPEILSAPTWKRSSRAIKALKDNVRKQIKYVEDPLSGRRTRIENSIIKISPKLNEKIHKDPRKIRVRVNYKILDPEEGRVQLHVQPI